MFIETSASIIVLAPILAPVAQHFGIDPVHFGIIMVVNLALGMITPPFGVNLFAACTVARISLDQIVTRLVPFVLVVLACLLVITYVPVISIGLRDLVYAEVTAAGRDDGRRDRARPAPAPLAGLSVLELGAADRRPVLHQDPRRVRRRGDQDRAAGPGRPAAQVALPQGRHVGVVARAVARQALGGARPAGSPRARPSPGGWPARPTSSSRTSARERWRAGAWATTRSPPPTRG